MGVYLKYGVAPIGGAKFTLQIKPGEEPRITFPSPVVLSPGESGKQFEVMWAEEGATILQAQLTELGGSPVTGDVFEADIYCNAGISDSGNVPQVRSAFELKPRCIGAERID